MGQRSPLFVALAAGLLAGCPVEPPSPDAGAPDAGAVDELCAALPPRDGGVLVTDCDPATGGRCDVRRYEACVWDVLADEGECRCSSQRVGLEAACSLSRQNCEPGLTCLFFDGDVEPRCRSVCSLEDGAGCEVLEQAAAGRAIACAPVGRGPNATPTAEHGVCLDVGQACDVFDDRCPADEKCSLLGRTTACAPLGSAGPGEPCERAGCQRGALCIALADTSGNQFPAQCYEPCEVVNPSCTSGQCIDIGLEFGICFEG